jgi:hypothetical protein
MRAGMLLLAAVMFPAVFAYAAPVFMPDTETGAFRFDTGRLSGVLRADGRSLGLVPLVYPETETPLAAGPGIFNYYRLFTTNHRHGESARGAESTAERLPDGAVKVTWPVTEERPFVLTGIYRWRAEGVLDLETIVTAEEALPDFEVFLAAYLAEGFPETKVCTAAGGSSPVFTEAGTEPGVWQVFPRNDAARELVYDGRWKIPPSPVDWAERPRFALPLAYRAHETAGITIAVMAPAEDCFAVFTPCTGEGHRSMYLSLFGRDIAKGETARTSSRLLINKNLTENKLLEHYREFVKETKARG